MHNTADFFFTFLVLETFVEPVEMACLIDGDRQLARQTEGVLALINFSYQELTWNSFHRPLIALGVREGGRDLLRRG